MKTVLTITALICTTFISSAQITFKKTFGTTGFEDGRSVIQLADSSYIIVGSTGEFGQTAGEVYIMKIDSAGNYVWSKSIGGINVDRANQVILTLDSSLAIIGSTNSIGNGGYDAYLIKTDIDGNLIWESAIGGADWDFGNSVTQLSDSSFVITGESYSYGSGNAAMYVARVGKTGAVLWENAYLSAGDASGTKVISIANGNALVAGISNNGSDNDARLMEIEPNGNLVWSSTFGSAGFEDEFYDVLQLPNDNFVACGSTNNGIYGDVDMLIMGIDQVGDTMWVNYGGGPGLEKAYGLSHLPSNNEFFVSGITYSYGAQDGLSNVQIYRLNVTGWYIQGWTAGLAGTDVLYSIITTHDNGFCAVGSTAQGSGMSDVWVLKYDGQNDTLASGDTSHVDITSIGETSTETNVVIYPNPSNGVIYSAVNTSLSIKVFDLGGRLVLAETVNLTEGLSLKKLSTGTYFITGTNSDGRVLIRDKVILRGK